MPKKIISKVYIIILLFLFTNSSYSQTFNEVDFEKLILNHPMMKKYDNNTGYFNNSSYALQDVEKLKKEVEELEEKLATIKEKESNLSKKTTNIEDDDEEVFWNNINDNSQQINTIEDQINQKNELITNNGDPGYQYLFEITSKIVADVILPLFNKDKIVLNNLPRYYTEKPNVGLNFEPRNLFRTDNVDFVKEYIEKTRPFASLFPNFNKTILYNSNKNMNIDKIATLDLTLAFMLHPKMAYYNFMKVGFNKYELNLFGENLDNYLNNLKKETESLKPRLDELKLKLTNLTDEKVSYYNMNIQNIWSENIYSFYKSQYLDKEKEIKKEIFDLEYMIKYPEIESPSDTIKDIEQIYEEIDKAIKEVIEENNLEVIINNNIPKTFDYKGSFTTSNITGLGQAGINYYLFYAFYNKNHLTPPFYNYKIDYLSNRWFDLYDKENTEGKYVISLKPYPIVLTGGKSILSNVVKKLYAKNKVNPVVNKVLDSVIEKVESYQYGKDY